MKPRIRKRATPKVRADRLVRQVIDPKFEHSKLYKSAERYAEKAREGRLGRSPISRPFWFNRVEDALVRNEQRAIANFRSPEFRENLLNQPKQVMNRVISRYRKLRLVSGQLRKIARSERTQHPLTPASMNRTGFDEQVGEVLRRPNRKPLSLAVIDLDFFGSVNKVFGNAVGNRVLEVFTESFKDAVLKIGFHARTGGDEFQVLGRVSPRQMKFFLDRFREQFVHALKSPSFLREVRKLKDPKAKMSEWKPPSFTAGVAGTKSHTRKIQNARLLLRRMHAAMQLGKRQGRERTLVIATRLAA